MKSQLKHKVATKQHKSKPRSIHRKLHTTSRLSIHKKQQNIKKQPSIAQSSINQTYISPVATQSLSLHTIQHQNATLKTITNIKSTLSQNAFNTQKLHQTNHFSAKQFTTRPLTLNKQHQFLQSKSINNKSSVNTILASFFSTTTQSEDELVLEKRYKRVLFHAEQRGWLELDLICGSFVRKYKNELLNDKSLVELTNVLALENSDLIRWLVEARPIPDEWKNNKVLQQMLEYAYSPNKPWYPQGGNQ